MKQRIFGLENEYGLIFSPNGRIYLPMEKVLGYIFEGLIPNSWPSNAFLVNGARFYQDTGCHPEYSTPECDNILDLVVHDKAGERLLEACLPAAEERRVKGFPERSTSSKTTRIHWGTPTGAMKIFSCVGMWISGK